MAQFPKPLSFPPGQGSFVSLLYGGRHWPNEHSVLQGASEAAQHSRQLGMVPGSKEQRWFWKQLWLDTEEKPKAWRDQAASSGARQWLEAQDPGMMVAFQRVRQRPLAAGQQLHPQASSVLALKGSGRAGLAPWDMRWQFDQPFAPGQWVHLQTRREYWTRQQLFCSTAAPANMQLDTQRFEVISTFEHSVADLLAVLNAGSTQGAAQRLWRDVQTAAWEPGAWPWPEPQQ